jgi:hypothetical protein
VSTGSVYDPVQGTAERLGYENAGGGRIDLMSDAHDSQDADHGRADEGLGPIDVAMWGVGILGVALGLLVALCCAFAVGML